MGKINIAVFNPDENTANVHDLWQWDYGQILRIQGLNLPSAVEIHFSLLPTGGEAKRRIGVTKDGVTDVVIPDFCLEADMVTKYIAYAFIYLSDTESGETVKRIQMHITARPKPEAFESPEAEDLFRQAIEASRESLDGAREAEKSAEAWAHGREDCPDRAEDNAAYYAGQAQDALKEVSGMKENVTQMQEQTRQYAESAEQSKDSAAGYAASADISRRAAETSEHNINAQVTGFDAHVAEKTSESEQSIEAARIAANKAMLAQQEQSVGEVARVGGAAVSEAQTAAQTATEKAQAAATSEKNAAASETAAKLSEENATKMAEQVATDKEQVAYDRTTVENAKQEMTGSVAQIEQNTQGITELKGDLDKLNEGGLNLKDAVIAEDVNKWLGEHPEATTTVQDGAITFSKLNSDAVKKMHVYNAVLGLGCDPKGEKECGDILQDFINSLNTGALIYFPPGSYKWNRTVATKKNLALVSHRGTAIINNTGNVACLKASGNCYVSGLSFVTDSQGREEYTVYSNGAGEFVCRDCFFSGEGGQNGVMIEDTIVSTIDSCKFNHAQIDLKTWDCKIINTFVWALKRPFGIAIRGGSENINLNSVDIVPPFRTPDGNMQSQTVLTDIKAGVWVDGVSNNIIMENIYLDGNPQLNTGIGILCEKSFCIAISTFRATKMTESPIIIDSCYDVVVSKGMFYNDDKNKLGIPEILVRKTYNSKHDSIIISDNHFVNYTRGYSNKSAAINVDDGAESDVIIDRNVIRQTWDDDSAYKRAEISTPSMRYLSTNIGTKSKYRMRGSFVIKANESNATVSFPVSMAVAPKQENFRFWRDNGVVPSLRVQAINFFTAYVSSQITPTSDMTIYYEITI